MRCIAVVVAALVASTISAQSQEADWAGLASSNPNAFVLRVQTELTEQNYYDGIINGILGSTTIRAINAFCSDTGAQCRKGPLSEEGAAAIVAALGQQKARALPDTIDNLSESLSEDVRTVGADSGAIDPESWRSSTRNGVSLTPAVAGSALLVEITGEAGDQGWANLESPKIEASAGQMWTFITNSMFETDIPDANAKIRLAAFDTAGKYLGELAPDGVEISSIPDESYSVSGDTPAGTAWVMPYIQLRYPTGSKPEDTLRISGANLSKTM